MLKLGSLFAAVALLAIVIALDKGFRYRTLAAPPADDTTYSLQHARKNLEVRGCRHLRLSRRKSDRLEFAVGVEFRHRYDDFARADERLSPMR
jgi:hypothetical protein